MPDNMGELVAVGWLASRCPFCETVNWIYCSNQEGSMEVYSCRCFNCNKYFWLDESIYEVYVDFEGLVGEELTDDPSEVDYEDGKPEPK